MRVLRPLHIICSLLICIHFSPLNSQIVYKEIDPPHTVISGQGYEIDFNEDSIVDLLIWKDHYKVGAGCIAVQSGDIFSLMPNDTAYMYFDSTGVVYPFSYLDTIHESLNCMEDIYFCPNQDIYQCPFLIHHEVYWHDCSTTSSTMTGLYREVRNKYLGFRLKILEEYHYGWINFSKPEGVDFIIRAYAYHTIPEQGMVIDDPFYTAVETKKISDIYLYPNPVHEVLTFKNMGYHGSIEIFDMSGRMAFSQQYHNSTISIPVSSLVKGLYILRVTTPDGIAIKKFIKE